MINGIDLLFAIISLILLFGIWYFGELYADWSEWNHRRRRQRTRARMRVYEEFEREEYLTGLRWTFRLQTFSRIMNDIGAAARRAAEAFESFNRQLGDSQQKHSI
jgi:hypothetical protein